MKKFTLMLSALVLAMSMSATVVTMNFTDSTELKAMGVTVPAAGKSWNLVGNAMVKDGVTLTGEKNATTDNRIFNSNGALSFRSYKKNTITFTVTGTDTIKGLIFKGTVGFDSVENSRIAVDKQVVKLTCTSNSTINMVNIYINEQMPSFSIDTISVAEARARIDAKKYDACYIKGVVVRAPYDPTGAKKYTSWLTDIDNPNDSIEAFNMRKGKEATATYASLDEMAKDFGLLDTVLIYADGLMLFGSNVYETTSGYFAQTIGKAKLENANEVFKYPYGAVKMDSLDGKQRFEVIISKVSVDDNDHALHFIVRSGYVAELIGSHTAFPDSSFVDGEGPVQGQLQFTFKEESGTNNKYAVKGIFQVGAKVYSMDTTYIIPGFDIEENPIKLINDRPFTPAAEGDTITCAEALRYARSLSGDGMSVCVLGYAIDVVKAQEKYPTQQSVYMVDAANETAKYFQAFYCKTQDLDSIVKGDYLLVKGKVSYFSAKDLGEISNGDIYRLQGDAKHQRNVVCQEEPAEYISVAQAVAIGEALEVPETTKDTTVYTEETYTVVGYISKVDYQTSSGSASWYMNDTKGETYGELTAYKCTIPTLIAATDRVMVVGKIAKYVKGDKSSIKISIREGAGTFVCDPTGIEEMVEAAKQAPSQKVLIDGQLYIMQEGVLYNAQGMVIR